ncbi:hypothetical protein Tco_0683516 [Tanacetum coccineum]|uniref:Uncharacterized protein n=1 Tax=Tanacetum coccineum TaxID=301880 RepID=A0ABQ4XUV2_9ASTR
MMVNAWLVNRAISKKDEGARILLMGFYELQLTKEKVRSGGGSGGGGAGRYLSMSKDGGGHEYVAYTVHIPPTPDHQFMANSQDCLEYGNVQGDPNENRIKDRVFTGWFDSETRAHAKRMKSMEVSILKSKLLYQVNGCDQKLFMNPLKLNVNAGSESVQGFT